MHKFDFEALPDLSEPEFERTSLLVDAIGASSQFSLKAQKLWTKPSGDKLELLVVELECDGVPDQNPAGIEYREPLGLLIGPSDAVPNVWALRPDFPSLLHGNETGEDMPFSLCIYLEEPRVVNRTWTAGSFLKRIYWWMESSASDTVHPEDQPVEQLFFNSQYELVLPADAGRDFTGLPNPACITRVVNRGENAATYFLGQLPSGADQGEGGNTPVENVFLFDLPPVIHGTILSNPPTLAKLLEILECHGLTAENLLKEKVHMIVGDQGVQATESRHPTVILVRVPIVRSAGAEPERIQIKAFVHREDPIRIGLKMGYLLASPENDKIHRDLLGTQKIPENVELQPLDVLELNTREDFSFQSGIGEYGAESPPKYTLIGAGAFGSALLDMWERSGWPVNTLIDRDHIKPHNLTRHTTGVDHIGCWKVVACADRTLRSTRSDSALNILVDDACAMGAETKAFVVSTDLVFDVSTSLDYSRASSLDDELPRHCTLFVTPNGNDGVMMFEDANREVRLRTLESQYYRALINEQWGENHLIGHLGEFISGASCRDISLRLPYSSIIGHAARMAEQARCHASNQESCIRVWKQDPISGAVDAIKVETEGEIAIALGDFTVSYDSGLTKKLVSLREARLPVETGGILLGYIDFNIQSIFIVDALSAPPESEETITSFQRGNEGVLECLRNAQSRTTNIVDYVGEWHSHPVEVEAKPSRLDIEQLAQLVDILAEDGLPAIQMIVGEDGVRVFLGE